MAPKGTKIKPRSGVSPKSAVVKSPGTVKRSVTFSQRIDSRAHELVGDRGFSAFVNEATAVALQFAATDQFIHDYENQHGTISEGEMAVARRSIQDARKRRV